MPFIGTTPTQGFVGANPKQSFTANGSTTVFTLTNPVASANDLEVFVGNVRQEPTAAYTAAGTTLTMSEAPATGLNFYVINKSQAQVTTTPPVNSISTDKIVNSAITDAKIGGMAASKLTGAMPALDGSALTGLDTDAVLLQSQTASGASAITVGTASLFSSTYIVYKIIGSNIHHSDDATGRALFVLDGTEKTGNYYRRVRARMYSGSTSIHSDRAHGGDAFWDLCYGESIGNDTGEMTNFEMTIWSPHTTDNFKGALCQSFGTDLSGASCQWQYSASHYNTESNLPLTGVKFYPASGTITSGEFRLYGMKSS